MRLFRPLLLASWCWVAALGCGSTQSAKKYSRAQASSALRQLEVVGLELGVFPIDGSSAIIDGDTIRVRGLNSSLRLLAIDTEETFKKDSERQLYTTGWKNYLRTMRGSSTRPVKMASPLGEAAKKFAQAFFEGASEVKLERDHPGEIRDYFNRYLAYVFVKKNGQWVNYNLECVRAGMSPYFTKYGRSRRFHSEFVEAQKQAQDARLGIWNPQLENYGDYPERLAWWDGRGDIVHRFETEMAQNPNYVVLTRWDAMKRLEKKVGQNVTLLGSVNEIRLADRGPAVVKLGRTRGNDFEVVFFDRDVMLSSGILEARGEYVRISGVVHKYRDPRRNLERLQVVVSLPGQVELPTDALHQLLSDEPGEVAPRTINSGVEAAY